MASKDRYLSRINGNLQELKLHYKSKISSVLSDVDRAKRIEVMRLIDDLVNDIYKHVSSVVDAISKDYDVYFGEDEL